MYYAGFLRKVHLRRIRTYQGKDGLPCVSNSRPAGLIASARLVFRPEIFLVSIVPRIEAIGVAANPAASAAHSDRACGRGSR
jgi:hypothetical protein